MGTNATDQFKEEIVGRWLAVKRGNAGLSRDTAAYKLDIEVDCLKLIEEGSIHQLSYIFEKMMSLYDISEFEVMALRRDLQ